MPTKTAPVSTFDPQCRMLRRFENSYGWLEVRLHIDEEHIDSDGRPHWHVSGHWKTWKGDRYWNTGAMLASDNHPLYPKTGPDGQRGQKAELARRAHPDSPEWLPKDYPNVPNFDELKDRMSAHYREQEGANERLIQEAMDDLIKTTGVKGT